MLSKLFYSAAQHLPGSLSKTFNRAANHFEQHEKQRILFAQLMREKEAGKLDEMDACQRIAHSVHEKMVRRNGKTYIESHIKGVVDAPNLYAFVTYTPEQKKLAWVHDVPEDACGAWKVKHFKKLGFSKEFTDGLDGLTCRPHEDYFDYIERLSKTIALEVKIGDNLHNWSDNPKPIREKLYRIASHYLRAVSNKQIDAGSSIAEWAAREGMYDLDLFRRYSSRPMIHNYTPPAHKSHMASISLVASNPLQATV